MKVPFLDVQAGYLELKDDLDAALGRVAASGRYILGPEVEAFEAEFAAYVGAAHCVGVGSGLAGLHLALLAMGVGPGDEVIVPSNTFVGTWMAVSHVGATPVPVEPDPITYNLDPGRIEAAITPRTAALLPVHLYGQPADMEPILSIARQRGLLVLEDAAQAHGARYRGRRVGALGDAAAFSFYPGKNLGALGDGGAVTTDDTAVADRARLLRDFGCRHKFRNEVIGFNNRLDEMQAALLRVKLAHLDEWNGRRRAVAAIYLAEIEKEGVTLPAVPDYSEPCWHLFSLQCDRRDALREYLLDAGIDVGLHYPVPPHRQPAYGDLGLGPGSLPISERLHARQLSLPIGPHLGEAAAWQVVDAVGAFPA